jgi:DNA-binding HxlR family transcriptional regulator
MGKKEVLCEDIAGKGCGLKRVLDLIGGKWKVLILCLIDQKEVVRYGELRRGIYGITNTMLATSLKEMENDGMVLRTQYDEMPVRVEYRLTDRAKSIIPILLELKKWGEANMD